MQFTNTFIAFVTVALSATQVFGAALGDLQVLEARQGRPTAFTVGPAGGTCGTGINISCSPSPGNPCKGNFNTKQASVVVTRAASNCHVSLYPNDNQGGGVIQRVNTDVTGVCVFTNIATWKSYGIYCD